MGTEDLIHVARLPRGFCARRIGAAALLSLLALSLLPGGARLLAGAAALGAAVAHLHARRCLLTRSALVLAGPLGLRRIPLEAITRLCVGRRGPLSAGRWAALLSGDLWLPPHWSGVELVLKDGARLFVPAEDAQQLARCVLRLRPQIQWDDLSENDYFAFLEQNRPDPWPRLTRSSIPSASARSSGFTTSLSVPSRG